MKRQNRQALAEEPLRARQIRGICSNAPGEQSAARFVQHCKWTVFIGCLCGNVFDTTSFFFFFPNNEPRHCPSPHGKRPKNLSRILLLHIILKTPHYGTSADNDLSLYLLRLPRPLGHYLKHARIIGKRGFYFIFFSCTILWSVCINGHILEPRWMLIRSH